MSRKHRGQLLFKMAINVIRRAIYLSIFVLLVVIINKWVIFQIEDSVVKAKLLRFQFSCCIITMMTFINCYIWRNLSTVLDFGHSYSDNKEWTFLINLAEFRNWKQYTVNSALWRLYLSVILVSSLFSYTTFSFMIRTNPLKVSIFLFLCFAMTVQLFCGLVITKLATLVWRFCHRDFSYHTERQNKTKQFVILAYSLIVVTVGFYNAMKLPDIKEVTIPVKDMPKSLNRMTITFVSDIHLGPTTGQQSLERIVNMINYLNSDLVIIGGDLVDGRVSQLEDAVESLSWIKARYGQYFVTGNHEYYTTDAHNWIKKLKSLGIETLHNSNVKISAPGSNDAICLAGVDDPTADLYGFMDHTMDLDSALRTCDPSQSVVLIAHQPKVAKIALDSKYRVDLVLSGHTHGGQMFPLMLGAYLLNPFYAGLYRHGDQAHVYVSMGTRFWGFPVRFGTSSEISHITLVST
ncbi:transmembrane protein with metallophosphoesterase domain-like isoform X1 [Dreissena polymorpha]|uniref:transmembrane protein with metallophosphoesterase domain-like isoform X1 n=1 Tax=Dreissena polymorpha TaxID=45954 RepID=UPI002263B0C1|nr:transmembrane protein with metallophosphoesterase domain-like isoform X1 [Dreissena polymorpha]